MLAKILGLYIMRHLGQARRLPKFFNNEYKQDVWVLVIDDVVIALSETSYPKNSSSEESFD